MGEYVQEKTRKKIMLKRWIVIHNTMYILWIVSHVLCFVVVAGIISNTNDDNFLCSPSKIAAGMIKNKHETLVDQDHTYESRKVKRKLVTGVSKSLKQNLANVALSLSSYIVCLVTGKLSITTDN